MEDAWKQRLREVIDADVRSMKSLSEEAGHGQNYVQQMLKDDKDPGFGKLIEILKLLGSSATLYVVTGRRFSPEDDRFLQAASHLDKQSKEDAARFLTSLLESSKK